MKQSIVFSIFTFLIYFNVNAAGFSDGEKFVSTEINGEMTVNCQSGTQSQTAFFSCRDNLLSPAETSYFIGPVGIRASQVNLYAKHADGSQVDKKLDYKSDQGKSERVNLWLASLFQKPLLDYGVNDIRFKMKDSGGSTVSEGSFVVQVDRGTARQCRHQYYNSNDINDCTNSSFMCDRYFRDENYCQ